MQHKNYFVALLCGALCLTGCLKNEESASVAQVREGKANELNASAELLKAQAAAATTLASAEATLKQAQAELEKANASLVMAQAETEKVQAELLKVQVQLQNVIVDEEKVRLRMLEAELQQKLAELSVSQAKAEAEIQKWLNELAELKAQAETQAIKAQQELLEAQHEMDLYLQTLEAEKMEEAIPYINAYFALAGQLVELQKKAIDSEIAITQFVNGANGAIEVMRDEINAKTEVIADAQASIAYYEQYQTMSAEEIQTKLAGAYAKVNETLATFAEASNEFNAANDAINEFTSNNASVYTSAWDAAFKNHINAHSRVFTEPVFEFGEDVDPVQVYGIYVENEAGDDYDFLPLWKEQQTVTDYVNYGSNEKEGTYNPSRSKIIEKTLISPAKVYTENINTYLDLEKAAIDEIVANKKQDIDDDADADKADLEESIASYEEQIADYAEYVSTRKATVEAAEQAFVDALNTYNGAVEKSDKARSDYEEYMIMTYDISRAKFVAVYTAKSAKLDADDKLTEAKNALETEKGKKPTDEQIYNAEKTAAEKQAAYNKAVKTYNDGKTAEALTTASAKYALDKDGKPVGTAVDEQKTAQEEYDAKVAEWRAADIAATANPEDEALAGKAATAKTAMGNANTELTKKNEALANAKKAYENAKKADDDAKKPVADAKDAWDKANKEVADLKAWTLDPKFQTAVDDAQKAANAADKGLKKAETALANAFKALDQKGVKYEEDPQFAELYSAYQEASTGVDKLGFSYYDEEKDAYVDGAAGEALNAVEKLYTQVYKNKDGYDSFNYRNAAYQIDPEFMYVNGYEIVDGKYVASYWPVGGYERDYDNPYYEDWEWEEFLGFDVDTGEPIYEVHKEHVGPLYPYVYENGERVINVKNSLSYKKAQAEELLANLPKDVEAAKEAVDEAYAAAYEEIEAVRAKLATFDQFAPAYDNIVAKLQELYTARDEAQIAALDAEWAYRDAKAEFTAMQNTLTDWVYEYDPDNDSAYRISVQNYIAYLNKIIAETEAEIDEIYANIDAYVADANVTLAKMQMDYEILIKKIAALQKVADEFQSIVEELLGISLSAEETPAA